MKLFVDVISGDEMSSDTYKMTKIYNDACYEFKANYRVKKGDQIMIASDDVAEDDFDCVTVVDIADAGELNEVTLAKKDVMGWGKKYLKKIEAHLKENGKEDRVPEFKKGATELFKLIISRFDEFQIYTGKSLNMDAGMAFSYQKEQEDEGPTFLYFADGLKEEKL